jgi:hypothetical protein
MTQNRTSWAWSEFDVVALVRCRLACAEKGRPTGAGASDWRSVCGSQQTAVVDLTTGLDLKCSLAEAMRLNSGMPCWGGPQRLHRPTPS